MQQVTRRAPQVERRAPRIERRSDVETPPRRDPAPTRLAYRMNRLWLTPLFRAMLHVGLPAFLVVFCTGLYLADEGRRDGLTTFVQDVRRALQERPEFMVEMMAIDGASQEVSEDIREILPLDFPVSSFDLNLEDMRRTIAGLDAVARAELHIRAGGVLQITIDERVPAVVWRGRDGLELLDVNGLRVAALGARSDRPDLPLIAGEGAYESVPEALDILAAANPIADRIRGLVRVGARRWDVVLDRGQRVMLPETGAVRAMERVIAMDKAEEMLARDLLTVDLRQSDRPTLRMSDGAFEQYKQIKIIEAGVLNR
jgi:cell division protein FtsQ